MLGSQFIMSKTNYKLPRAYSTLPNRRCFRLARCGWLTSSSGIRDVSLPRHFRENKTSICIMWLLQNLSTNSLLRTWSYPYQKPVWHIVVCCKVVCISKHRGCVKGCFLPLLHCWGSNPGSHAAASKAFGCELPLRQFLNPLSKLTLTHSVKQQLEDFFSLWQACRSLKQVLQHSSSHHSNRSGYAKTTVQSVHLHLLRLFVVYSSLFRWCCVQVCTTR